jgi:hypothetical protein
VARGAEAGEFAVDDPELTASSLHDDRGRLAFVGASWSLCDRVLGITR